MFWIRGRRLWGARRPRSITRSDWAHRDMTIVAHHTADNGPARDRLYEEFRYMRGIQAFHMGPERGWSDIGYNYLIVPSGRVYEGRGFGVVGAHAPGYNTNGIGICFAGNGDAKATDKQIAAYHALVKRLRQKGANIVDVKAHGDVFATSCPGKGIRRQLGL